MLEAQSHHHYSKVERTHWLSKICPFFLTSSEVKKQDQMDSKLVQL